MTETALVDDFSLAAAVGARAAARREELGLTQAELASRVGVSREWVLRFERGNSGANLGGVLNVLQELNITLKEQATSIAGPPFVVADSLDRLHGPASGEVSLPKRLLWNPSRPFNLNDEKHARSMLRIVLREARQPEDLETYVNRDQLTRLWTKLSLPDYISKAWEQKFPELTKAPELAHA